MTPAAHHKKKLIPTSSTLHKKQIVTAGKRIAIICYLDDSANSVRPHKLKTFFEKCGHHVTLINTLALNRNGHGVIIAGENEYQRPHSWRLQCILNGALDMFNEVTHYRFCDHLVYTQMKLSASILAPVLQQGKYDVVLCELEPYALALRAVPGAISILDAASPSVEEMKYAGHLFEWEYKRLRRVMLQLYPSLDYLNFHWYTYAEYVKDYLYNGDNFITVNWGCEPKQSRANFAERPRILFRGNLSGYWTNFPLLSALSKQYPIDVYGTPAPHPKWGLHYKGPSASADVCAQYQFGLITITKDRLRRRGFSSKHTQYLSYGLPVLTPAWRKDPLLATVSIEYTEDNFLEKLTAYSKRAQWQRLADRSYELAQRWEWDRTLQPFASIVAAPKPVRTALKDSQPRTTTHRNERAESK
jgi:hypothetical protein